MKIKLKEGLELSRIVHGHWRLAEWNLTAQQLLELIENCIALGITTFDHADIYGDYTCERLFGNAMLLNKKLREEIQVVTKCGIKLKSAKFPERIIGSYDYSYQHIVNSANQSLKNLETDYIDLLLLHRPSPFFNPEEVAKAFDQLLKAGKVRHFGVSNFSVGQQEMLAKYLDMKLVTNQVEISPYCLDHFENGNVDYFLKENIKPMAWSPLAGGRIMLPIDAKGERVLNTL
jgi:predicted oxidoreductase